MSSVMNENLIAILRGLQADAVEATVEVLASSGVSAVEVPLNYPGCESALKALCDHFGKHLKVGAGTLRTVEQLDYAHACGVSYCLSPHCDPIIIEQTKQRELIAIPGVCTPTEAFTALNAGADALKLFPSTMISPKTVEAFCSVMDVPMYIVGGVTLESVSSYITAGAYGVGVGKAIYSPNKSLEEIKRDASLWVKALSK